MTKSPTGPMVLLQKSLDRSLRRQEKDVQILSNYKQLYKNPKTVNSVNIVKQIAMAWQPDAVCDGLLASQRAEWLMGQGQSSDAAQRQAW